MPRRGGVKNRNAHTFPRSGHYPEEYWVDTAFFRAELLGGARTVFDGCVGWGLIPDAAAAAGHKASGSDIVDRANGRYPVKDFFEVRKRFDAIVMNTPFSRRGSPLPGEEQFARHALILAPYVAIIMLTRKLNAALWLEELPLARILLIHPRPSMPSGEHILAGGKVGNGTQDYCWLIFKRDHIGAPEIHRLHCEQEKAEARKRRAR